MLLQVYGIWLQLTSAEYMQHNKKMYSQITGGADLHDADHALLLLLLWLLLRL